MSSPFRRRLSSPLRRGGALILALTMSVGPVGLHGPGGAAYAQIDKLPDLGGTGSGELSGQDERKLGESIMRELRMSGAVYDDAELTDYLNRFAAKLAGTPAARGTRLEFFVVPEDSINAFALPGGFVGIHTGLLAAASTESELASVMSHEIAHVTQHHISRMLGQQRQASLYALAGLVLAALAARSAGDAAIGALMLGDTAATRSMLSFSRDAEREADRVGLEILESAKFDVRAAPRFFEKLQQYSRFNEGGLGAYFMTHPMSGERMTDLQLRIQESKAVTHTDSFDFRLASARARSIGNDAIDQLKAVRKYFEDRTVGERAGDPAMWFGLACVLAVQRDYKASDRALAQARKLHGQDHRFFDRLEAANALDSGDAARALKLADAALVRWPEATAFIRLRAQSMIALKDYEHALAWLREQTRNRRSDAMLWRLQAEAHQGLAQSGQAHMASAEAYLIEGQLHPAIEQLRLARNSKDLDFYNGSIVDAKLREAEQRWRDLRKDGGEQMR